MGNYLKNILFSKIIVALPKRKQNIVHMGLMCLIELKERLGFDFRILASGM